MKKTKHEYYMMDAVFKSKLFLESLYAKDTPLKWIYTKPLDSYNDDRNRIEIYVLEGEPPRGLVLANYGLGTVIGLDIYMKQRIHTCVL